MVLGLSRLQLALLAMLAYGLYTSATLHSLQRPSLGGSAYIEDTDDGAGTRFRVLRRAAATRGAFINIQHLIRPGAPGFYAEHAGSPPFHSHVQEESIVVKKGVLTYLIGAGRPANATAGETVVVPSGEPHTYHNPSATEDVVIETILVLAPPLGERYFENLAGLSRTYGGARAIHPLQMVLLMSDAGVKMHGTNAAFSFASENIMPHVARALGFKSTYPEYASGSADGGSSGGGGGSSSAGGGGSSGGDSSGSGGSGEL